MAYASFDRDTRGVQLTPDGHKVLEYADRMVSTLHQLQAAVAQRPGFEGRVRVGAMDSVIHTWLSPLIARTAEMFPALEIELVADSAMAPRRAATEGRARHCLPDRSAARRKRAQRAARAVPDPLGGGHQLAVGAPIRQGSPGRTCARTAHHLRAATPGRSQDMLNLLHLSGVESPRVNCVNSVAAMTRLVGDGFGVGALPTVLVRDRIESGALTVLEVEPALPAPADHRVVARGGGPGGARSHRRPGAHDGA
ncbi:LysR family transcriptional regulator [Cupriavidus basilensis]